MDISLMSRDEKLLRRLLGESIEIEDPQSRIEFLLKQIIDAGGIGGGSYKIRDQYDTYVYSNGNADGNNASSADGVVLGLRIG